MALLTENKVSKTLDIPVNLPATELKMGDWLVVASIKLKEPMKLTYWYLTFQMIASSVDTRDIIDDNKISPALDLAFLGLYRDYTSGHPSDTPALDVVRIRENISVSGDCIPVTDLLGQFITVRSSPVLAFTTPGVYSFIVANNMKSSASSAIATTTSIDFQLCVTGQIRLELDKN
ncbi:MAG: hypothetical protein ACOYB3_00080 [Azonexus sp.]